jgi:hypothetical protein
MFCFLAFVSTLQATLTSTAISPDIKGAVGSNSGDVESVLYMGNASPVANHMFMAIEKYSLSTISGTVQSAILSNTISANIYDTDYGSNPANYFIVQHYTYDNSTELCWDDAKLANTKVETITGVITAAITDYSWDVTSYVKNDIEAGYTHSGFRILMTDVNGTPMTNENGWQVVVWDASPSLTVTVPEPATLGLLGLSVLGFIQRKNK